MNFDQAMQLGQLAVTGMTTLWGFRAVVSRLSNYITVEEYRTGKAALHNEINALKVENAGLKRDVAHLQEDRAKR